MLNLFSSKLGLKQRIEFHQSREKWSIFVFGVMLFELFFSWSTQFHGDHFEAAFLKALIISPSLFLFAKRFLFVFQIILCTIQLPKIVWEKAIFSCTPLSQFQSPPKVCSFESSSKSFLGFSASFCRMKLKLHNIETAAKVTLDGVF